MGTTNAGKIAELEEGLRDVPVTIVSLKSLAGAPDVVEDGVTFVENALKKARALASFSGLTTLADDSGLEVDALGGAPGVHSARYSGPAANDVRNNEKLLRELEGVPPDGRGARFVCVLALCSPAPRKAGEWIFYGECKGRIIAPPRGENGFGYDPVFFYPPAGKTFGELDRRTKAAVSHRGQALQTLRKAWRSGLSSRIHS